MPPRRRAKAIGVDNDDDENRTDYFTPYICAWGTYFILEIPQYF